MKKLFLGRKNKIILIAAVVFILAAAASWTMAKSNTRLLQPASTSSIPNIDVEWSKAVLDVSNMSCGGCIDTIKKSVAAIPGTGTVNVDLTSASAEVLYDADRLTEPDRIAKAITDGGYPAKIQRLVSSRQFKQEMTAAAEKAKASIASVGRIDIPRDDYEIELGHARSRYEKIYGPDTFNTSQGLQLLQRIQTQIALRLVDEAIKFQEVDRAGYTLQNSKVDNAMLEYMKEKNTTLKEFEKSLEANGYPFAYFKRKFGQRVRLQDYLEEKVLADSLDPDDRQQRYGNWLANARTLAKVVYYDKAIEALVKSGSGGGCGGGGGGGCSSGGGSCSVSSR